MGNLTASDIANHFDVSRARVSQWVSEGKLDGCYQGEGRSRRFDAAAVATALGKTLDPGQLMGNGAQTRRQIRSQGSDAPTPAPKKDALLAASDPDRYELARIQNAEEDARRKRRDNQRDEGRWVLAEEVQRQSAKALAQEIAQFETVLRDGARAVADRFGVDYREARALLMDLWRTHRVIRTDRLTEQVASVDMSAAEMEDDA
ncbi:hypothetical protein [Roseicitreum antarcticum]|uniref:Helix-turn-helix domain-containing protein n=1 Tax=Roseicitreum antarcticum TaxID=564137 RepID=A0A1H3ES15_9RHOB|nr:hypothetical protein [Roseicitreum antarcticum]SDX81531.1 hypothetical protein SAMN04488238_12519 [Roseicitreum antarcticum]